MGRLGAVDHDDDDDPGALAEHRGHEGEGERVLARQDLKPDAFGAVHTSFSVPASAALGYYSIRLTSADDSASGSFEVRLVTANTAGDDVFRARATHADEVCAGSATF